TSAGATVLLSPASISFGGFTGGKPLSSAIDVTFENLGPAVTCALSLTINDPTASGFFSLSASSLSLAAGGTGTVTATFNGGQAVGTGLFFGDAVASCGTATVRAPRRAAWWASPAPFPHGPHRGGYPAQGVSALIGVVTSCRLTLFSSRTRGGDRERHR